MLIAVLIINLLLVMLCWWAIWQIWRLRQAIADLREMLYWAESQTECLPNLSVTLIHQRQSLQVLRNYYQQTLLSLRQGQQLLSLITVGRLLWSQAQTRRGSSRSSGTDFRNRTNQTSSPHRGRR
jgi:hypothetical protein